MPVVVEFRAEGTTYAPATSDSFWRGETWVGNDQAVYLYNVGSHYFVSNDFDPVVTNITQAPIWHIYGAISLPSAMRMVIVCKWDSGNHNKVWCQKLVPPRSTTTSQVLPLVATASD